MKVKSEREVAQSWSTFHGPRDCSPPGSSVRGTLQARVLEWVATAFSKGCHILGWPKSFFIFKVKIKDTFSPELYWTTYSPFLFLQPLRVGASVLLNNFFPSITPHLFPQSWAHSCGLTKPRSPPGSPIPGIPQARTLEWVAISFSNAWKWKGSRSVVSYSQRPHGLQPIRFLCPWDFPGKSTRVGCHCLLRYWDDSCLVWWWVVDSYRSLPAEPLKVRRILVLSSCSPWTGKKPCDLLSGVQELPPLLHHPGYPDTAKLTQIYVPRHSTQPLFWKGFADCHCPTLVLICLCLRMAEEWDSEFLSHKPNSIKILLFTF